MTDQRVIQTAEAQQVPHVPKPYEIRHALAAELAGHARRGNAPFISIEIEKLIDRAFARANDGEFRA